LNDELSRLQA
jgi:hypothetical protein